MKNWKFDPSDIHQLTQVWLFVEHFNSRLATDLAKSASETDSREVSALAILLSTRKYLTSKDGSWTRRATTIGIAEDAGIFPKVNSAVINFVSEAVLHPARVEPLANGQWRLIGSANLSDPEPLDRLRTPYWLYATEAGSVSFASRDIGRDSIGHAAETALYWTELLDPIHVIQNTIMRALNTRDSQSADFYIQRWLKKQFDLKYSDRSKIAISSIAKRINELFYETPLPTRMDLHTIRSSNIGVRLLIEEIRVLLAPLESSNRASLRSAIGIYLILRFCHLLRCRYFWTSEPRLSDDASRGESHCISALRAVEYSYLLARMFGALTDIPGLTFVFRGGILPRSERGRTMLLQGPPGAGKTVFALQKLVSIASRGGLSIYFSFEEDYQSIVDRLITFNLVNLRIFEIKKAGRDIGELLTNWRQANPGRGLLVLYGHDSGDSTQSIDLPIVILQIAKAANTWKWKAMALDGLNAIQIRDGETDERDLRRTDLHHLIGSIESGGFLGIVLAEKDLGHLASMPYLSDTVLELGFDESNRTRWIEVKKCRTQNFHPGRHSCRITEGRGLRIYPSLSAIQSSLRRRINTTLSGRWNLNLTQNLLASSGEVVPLLEKATILVSGEANAGKTRFALELAKAGLRPVSRGTSLSEVYNEESELNHQGKMLEETTSVLFVNFRTTERRFEQNILAGPFKAWWEKLRFKHLRWYSPGENIGAGQIIGDIWNSIKESRRQGTPFQRIVFDELESAEAVMPTISREPLFWATLLQLVSTEAITTIFVVAGKSEGRSNVFRKLEIGVDYIIKVSGSSDRQRFLVLKRPELGRGESSAKQSQ